MTYFINFQLGVLDDSLEELKSYIERKMEEREKLYNFKRIEGVNDRQVDILNEFATDSEKSMTISEHMNTFNVAYQTSRSDLLELVEKGLLEKKKMGRKYVFFKSENFDEAIKSSQDYK